MRTVFKGISLTAFFATHAIAADLPSRAPPPVFVPPAIVTEWGGCYGGVFGGYDMARVRDVRSETTTDRITTTTTTPATTTVIPAFDNGVRIVPAQTVVTPAATTTTTATAAPRPVRSSFSKTVSGGDGGGRLGCNYQMQRFVIGGQIEGGYLDINGRATDPLRRTTFASVSGGAYGAASVKVGFALLERTLVYVRGGVGYAGLRFKSGDPALGYNTSVSGSEVMPLGGVGLEYKVTPSVSLTGEYTYLRPGCRKSAYVLPARTRSPAAGVTVDTTGSGSESSCVDKHMFTIGVNYYFNADVPVVARY